MTIRLLLIVLLAVVLGMPATADADTLERPAGMIELGNALSELGIAKDDVAKVKRALVLYKDARGLLDAPEMDPATLSEGMRMRRAAYVDIIRSRTKTCESFLTHANRGPVAAPSAGAAPVKKPVVPEKPPIKPLPKRNKGQLVSAWVRAAIKQFQETEDAEARSAYARDILAEAGVHALSAMYDIFEADQLPPVRNAIHEALATFGTLRVANQMKSYAARSRDAHWHHALDVIYRCLEKPDDIEAERPFQRAIRAFYALKERSLTVRIIWKLDQMGKEGVAALGEVVYVPDYGYHDHVVRLLGGKRDARAVPPLVYKMNRFKFESRVQLPAHEALLELGWYAVPELINRLDDKAAGIWISWSLRKITTETMGTDKRKWHDWWKSEKKRHPELFPDPDERPTPVTPR